MNQGISGKRALFIVLLACYLTVLLILTLFTHNYYTYGKSVNLEIFSSVRLMLRSRDSLLILKNVLGNIALFIPLGFLLPLVSLRMRFFLLTIGCGILFSLMIETVQYLFAARIFDIDDLLLNAAGTIIGRFLYSVGRFFRYKVMIFLS
ncbi:VanZ family protein [Sporolactobacillus shoreae]|uniref:VanZ family protein n=1 Tax=Sporolactobacillus shoreae TaxID=1465501 RepID=A0A4Z0GKD3_9BACL|nr:VanZ family protein [Sporolactobacillus shoreae]TGA96455.1 VanZ family protein [Sporolactobacillus shoreae]